MMREVLVRYKQKADLNLEIHVTGLHFLNNDFQCLLHTVIKKDEEDHEDEVFHGMITELKKAAKLENQLMAHKIENTFSMRVNEFNLAFA
jgi:hypothetical protein